MGGEGQEQTSVRRFQKVTRTRPIAGGARRGKPKAVIEPSGRTKFNVAATELHDGLAVKNGADPKQCASSFQADVGTGTVAVYPEKANTPGTVPVRREKTTAVTHMGGVFDEYPQLAVTGTRECAVTLEPDDKGVDCLMIMVTAGTAKPKGTRKRKSGTSGSQAKPQAADQEQPGTGGKGPTGDKPAPDSGSEKA
jgi:hypothetical protein